MSLSDKVAVFVGATRAAGLPANKSAPPEGGEHAIDRHQEKLAAFPA